MFWNSMLCFCCCCWFFFVFASWISWVVKVQRRKGDLHVRHHPMINDSVVLLPGIQQFPSSLFCSTHMNHTVYMCERRGKVGWKKQNFLFRWAWYLMTDEGNKWAVCQLFTIQNTFENVQSSLLKWRSTKKGSKGACTSHVREGKESIQVFSGFKETKWIWL